MEYRKILVDTSIVIDHLRKRDKRRSILFGVVDKYILFISTISVFELFAGATDSRKVKDIENILINFKFLSFTSEIAKKSGELYISLKNKKQILEIKDIFIGATAIIHNLPLLTLNKNHFERIEDIRLA